jgi:2-phosphosulfolactate phosphatase
MMAGMNEARRRIEVATLPAKALEMDADCFVVIDAFRATTTIATLFAGGLRSLIACARIEDAYRFKSETGALLFGEVDGLPPAGFDHGNSPLEASRLDVAGRDAVLFTTNGTAALVGVAARGHVFTGAFVNASAVAEAVRIYASVALVCAGNAGGLAWSFEDFAAAGAIARAILALEPERLLGVSVPLAITSRIEDAGDSHHAHTLQRLGMQADIDFALRLDTACVTPCVVAYGEGWARMEA